MGACLKETATMIDTDKIKFILDKENFDNPYSYLFYYQGAK